MTEFRFITVGQITYRYTIKEATWAWTLLLNTLGRIAICTPWRTIIILSRYISNDRLKRHEMSHAAQYERMGRWRFLAVYCWYALRHGYDQNPLEIEARQAERGR